MRKHILTLFLLLAFTAYTTAQSNTGSTPKYVFYFIGDGMGMNQVNGTETYLAAKEGRIGIKPLCFADFPHTAFATTFSSSHGITDSAAAGSALANGNKTYNGCIGLLPDSITPVSSIAVWAREAGAAVGITTSVSVDHATPAAFYAHRKNRNMYYEIGQDMCSSQFDFFAGSDFLKPERPDQPTLYQQTQDAGYTIVRGYKEYQKKARKADRILMLQTEEASKNDRSAIPYAIDRQEGDMTLVEITRAAIDFLKRKNPDRFFLMVEGGKIDWAGHNNDASTVYEEVIDMDNAVRVALDFYRKHPNETLIIVTADHETGGMGLGNKNYTLQFDLLQYQKMSAPLYSNHVSSIAKQYGDSLTWEIIKDDLKENFGFWDKVKIDPQQEKQLHKAYEDILAGREKSQKTLYSQINNLSYLAKSILNMNARIGWTSGSHTNGYVPVFAIGAGAQHFHGRIDNTDIPKIIAKVAGYKQ
ncbi:MAG: alkaline phosphatase [Bacteroidaceae bacterium]|nr:alkaline phosphatase [Bacteroidaceae bacterium]